MIRVIYNKYVEIPDEYKTVKELIDRITVQIRQDGASTAIVHVDEDEYIWIKRDIQYFQKLTKAEIKDNEEEKMVVSYSGIRLIIKIKE